MIIFVGEIRLSERTLKVRGPMKDENMHKRLVGPKKERNHSNVYRIYMQRVDQLSCRRWTCQYISKAISGDLRLVYPQ